MQEVGTPILLAGGGRAVVDAGVPDEVLEQVGGLAGPVGVGGHGLILRSPPPPREGDRKARRCVPAMGSGTIHSEVPGRWLTVGTYGI